jgi:aspartate carbamoyltransferase catalytic subunit
LDAKETFSLDGILYISPEHNSTEICFRHETTDGLHPNLQQCSWVCLDGWDRRGLEMKGLITMDDLTNEDILSILDDASRLLPVARGETYLPLLEGKILGNLFFEPSTRTRMSFETAMKRLGGDVVNLGDVKTSSVVKGETLFDTIQMVDGYTDIIAMRHPRQGAARYAQDAARVPILNGGDGAGHHPTQTMLDLFTILQSHDTL